MNEMLRDKVMAFSDGELPFEEWQDVLEAVVTQPDLLQFLNACRFTQGLRRVVDRELSGKTPERLLTTIWQWKPSPAKILYAATANSNTAADTTAMVTPLTPHRFRLPSWALAAAAALFVGASSGWLANQALRDDFTTLEARGLVASTSMQTALEATLSRETARVGRNLWLTPVLSFYSQSGKWCRQYELDHGTSMRSSGLACRDDDGAWNVQAQTAATPRIGGEHYKYVGENDRIIESVRTQIIDGDALTAQQEAAQIGDKWNRKP